MSGKTKFTYYPGCSSQGAGIHLDRSLHAIATKLDFELETIEDWNCCGASVGHVEGRPACRSFALIRAQPGAGAAARAPPISSSPCAACYLNTHFVNEKMKNDAKARGQINEALEAGGLNYQGDLKVRHICEVLVNDVGIANIKDQVTNPLHRPEGRGLGRLPDGAAVRGQGKRRAVHHLRPAEVPRRVHRGLRRRGRALRQGAHGVLRRLGRRSIAPRRRCT